MLARILVGLNRSEPAARVLAIWPLVLFDSPGPPLSQQGPAHIAGATRTATDLQGGERVDRRERGRFRANSLARHRAPQDPAHACEPTCTTRRRRATPAPPCLCTPWRPNHRSRRHPNPTKVEQCDGGLAPKPVPRRRQRPPPERNNNLDFAIHRTAEEPAPHGARLDRQAIRAVEREDDRDGRCRRRSVSRAREAGHVNSRILSHRGWSRRFRDGRLMVEHQIAGPLSDSRRSTPSLPRTWCLPVAASHPAKRRRLPRSPIMIATRRPTRRVAARRLNANTAAPAPHAHRGLNPSAGADPDESRW